ncbi:oxidoreductase [Paenibacillus sacheonensis]|uniref:Oxidoreductase n=1 Tax=Paenibacillus sacheonensis TaxID=742054 RepID=A0A7X5C193_9BACL|nr:oxidoreductase [Paenibacillus sacheonensis]MBM7565187.1 putative dehydrogenase [Paenibacillus sacheonensis]NBC70035.1 oxidoreductase [Paenibacillus sacheonensis]
MSDTVKVGLIGYGFAGSVFHAPVITSVPGLELTKVVERRSAKSKERYPWVEVVRDAEELYADDAIDLVVVTTPSTDHYAFVKKALLAGKHVVVEKPFTPSSADAEELIELAKKQGKVLTVYHNRRFDGDFLTLRELLRQELLGEVKEAEFHWDGFDPVMRSTNWREGNEPGTGVFYDLGVHLLDQAVKLFGVPASIAGDVQIQRDDAEAHDYFDVTLLYDSGLKVRLKSSKFVREAFPRYSLHGTKGSFVKYGIDPQEAALIAGLQPSTARHWGKEPKELWGKINTSVGGLHVEGVIETIAGSYVDYYRNVMEHINGKAELEVKPEEARLAIQLIELALQSSKDGRALPVPFAAAASII